MNAPRTYSCVFPMTRGAPTPKAKLPSEIRKTLTREEMHRAEVDFLTNIAIKFARSKGSQKYYDEANRIRTTHGLEPIKLENF